MTIGAGDHSRREDLGLGEAFYLLREHQMQTRNKRGMFRKHTKGCCGQSRVGQGTAVESRAPEQELPCELQQGEREHSNCNGASLEMRLPGWFSGKESNAGGAGLIPGSGRSPGDGNGNSL